LAFRTKMEVKYFSRVNFFFGFVLGGSSKNLFVSWSKISMTIPSKIKNNIYL